MIYTKLVNHDHHDETNEVAFYHLGPPLPQPYFTPDPAPGAFLRVCANDFQLPRFNVLQHGDILVLHQNIQSICQVITHVLQAADSGPASAGSPFPGWDWERRFEVLARLTPVRFAPVARVGPYGDRVAAHAPTPAPGFGEPIRLRHLLPPLRLPPGVQNGTVREHHRQEPVTGARLLAVITPANGFAVAPGFAAAVEP